jgi:hypothetical protein
MPLVTQPLHTVHVWLARSPGGGMHRGVWLPALGVCQAALMGMDQGRGVLYKWSKQRATPGEQPLPAHLNTTAQRVHAACRVAEAAFWDRLHDFVGLGAYPPMWADHVSPTHPFVCSTRWLVASLCSPGPILPCSACVLSGGLFTGLALCSVLPGLLVSRVVP